MPHTFDIEDFGAKPDSSTLSTAAIQQAIDACHDAGGGRVFCGPGRFLTGSLELKSRVELHLALGCELLASTSLDDYPEFEADGFIHTNAAEGSSKTLIRAAHASHIAITGPGEINGRGIAFYDPQTKPGSRFFAKPATDRPRMVTFFMCTDIRLENTAFLEAPCWTIWLIKCERAFLNNLRVAGDQRMINNDGIDIDACRDVTISNCICKTADDCLVIRNITRVCEEPGVCENITVTNCTFDSFCQGVRIGCPQDGVIRNCTLSNLTITSANNGIVFENPKRYLADGHEGTLDVTNMLISQVTINCEGVPIMIRIEEGIGLVRVADLSFSHIRATSGKPLLIQGSAETPIRNVTFSDVQVRTRGSDAIVCRNCEGVKMNQVELANLSAT